MLVMVGKEWNGFGLVAAEVEWNSVDRFGTGVMIWGRDWKQMGRMGVCFAWMVEVGGSWEWYTRKEDMFNGVRSLVMGFAFENVIGMIV